MGISGVYGASKIIIIIARAYSWISVEDIESSRFWFSIWIKVHDITNKQLLWNVIF
jgi:hypothetical protein